MRRLRILLILPLYGGSLPVGRFCRDALSRIGHVVETFEGPDFHPTYEALRNLKVGEQRAEHLQNSYLQQVVSQAVLAKVESFAPDLVLAMAQAPLSRQALKRLRRDRVATAMWFVEDFRLFTYWQAYAPFYDVFAVIQKEPFFSELRKVGQENVVYLPLAADPEFHCPMELSPPERRKWGGDVTFMGAGYPNRRAAFRRLLGHDLRIFGTEWDGDPVLEKAVQLGGRRVSSEECVKIFNASAINLNLHSSIKADRLVSGGDFVNPRTFELASCGAFQLVDQRSLLDEAFAADEVARFGDFDELRKKIDYYLRHEDERRAMAQRARERVLTEHSYEHRMADLLSFCERVLPGWPALSTDHAARDELPDELAGELAGLLDSLGLSRSVSFADLVWAVRNRQGELSPLDTAILFLDEWRKQYGLD
ncbi:CgeB family protein [Desulfohalovibrio reitneri]|uniref:CgeB family protein n=1 Tax=Desulfohalovibrio reitneri TaxID=1307759 RepID=UPI0004A6BA14|nr:glycosyltransferase [Desulfohalovibrio reitneri]